MAERVASRSTRAAAFARKAIGPAVAAATVSLAACPNAPQTGISQPPTRSSGGIASTLNPEIAARIVYQPAASMQIPRFGFGYVSTGDRVFAFGGATSRTQALDEAVMTDTIEMYDALSDTWSIVGRLKAPRFGAAAAIMPTGAIMIAGGIVKTGDGLVPTDEVFLFNPGTYQISDGPNLLWKAWGMSLFGLDKGFLAVGGFTYPPFPMSLNTQVFGDSAFFEIGSSKWETSGEVPRGRGLAAAGIAGGVPVQVTGRPSVLSSQRSFSPNWTMAGPTPRPGTPSPEGGLGSPDGDVHFFDFQTQVWTWAGPGRVRALPMYGAMTAQVPDGLAILGGIDATDQLVNYGYTFRMNLRQFNQHPGSGVTTAVLQNLPAKTALGGAAFLLGRLLVFGGLSETTFINRTAARSVTGDTWVLRDLNPQAQPDPGTSSSPGLSAVPVF